ncbi:MAG TPA: right-handed parallel beta-helix repeat-containing protein [Chitinophagaceae bacterium]
MKRLLALLLFIHGIVSAQTNNYSVDALVNPKTTGRVITVGDNTCDIVGFTNQSIQLAIDALPAEGGTVKMSPGTFTMMAPAKLRSNVHLIGAGPSTVLKRIDGFRSKFVIDADFGELKVTVQNVSGFKPGMSIQITNKQYYDCWDVSVAVITAIVGDTLYFDKHLIRDYEAEPGGMVTNAGSCVSVMDAENVSMSGFTINGNKEKNDLLDGCNGGGIVIIKSKKITVENVHVENFNGEGITWQITEDVVIRNNEISGCTNMGLHPGSGSPRSVIEGNNSHHNKVGLFICWRVHHSDVRNNLLHHNSENGISTGHKDNDVLFENNQIYENGADGVLFREEISSNSPHRNTFLRNTIENNGTTKGGYGIVITGNATGIVVKDNIIRDTKTGTQKAALFMGKNIPLVKMENNTMSGHAAGNIVYEKK